MPDYVDNGFIKLHRRILKHWILKRDDYFRAWVLILLEARWGKENDKILVGSQLIDCKRGESLNSLRTWANLFGPKWTVKKVRTFFALLEQDGMIVTHGYQKTTRLTICNYDIYQCEGHAKGTRQGNQRAFSGHSAGIQRATEEEREEYKERKDKEEKSPPFFLKHQKFLDEWILRLDPHKSVISACVSLLESLEDEIQTDTLLLTFRNQMKAGTYRSVPELVEAVRRMSRAKNNGITKSETSEQVEISDEDKNQLKNWGISI